MLMVETRSQTRKKKVQNTSLKKSKNTCAQDTIDTLDKKTETEESMSVSTHLSDFIDDDFIDNSINYSEMQHFKLRKLNDKDDDYNNFYSAINSIYNGDFFERMPLENKQDELKQKYNKDDISKMSKELEMIHKNYYNNSPSVIDILNMDISLEQKQKLLEKIHNLVNSEMLTPEYNSCLKFLTSNISNNTDPELLKLEKDILKESLNNGSTDTYKHKILKSNMSFDNKVIAYKKLEIMETYEETDTSEYAKYKTWIDILLSIPFGIYNKATVTELNSSSYIKNVRDTLDRKLSFLEKPKDQIINIVTHMIRNPDANINAIGLYGSPGVGKTSIVESIAEALNRPFYMISLGGESDASSLTGHGFTYIGSGPGALIGTLANSKTMSPVVLLDECDKISETQQGKEIIGTLIHLTDSTTNKKYNHDKYFSGIEFDLSKVLFVFTYNDPTKIDKILADRLFKIKVENYTFKEKLEITNKHLIPGTIDKFKFNKDDVVFSHDAIKHLVNSTNSSHGMRDIKIKIKIIFSRINTLLLTNESDNIVNLKYKELYPYYKTLPVTIPQEHVDIFLNDSTANVEGNSDVPFHMYI